MSEVKVYKWPNTTNDEVKFHTPVILKSDFDALRTAYLKLEKQLEVCKAGLNYYANHESVIGEVTQDEKKNVQVVHTFINHKAKECLKQLEEIL